MYDLISIIPALPIGVSRRFRAVACVYAGASPNGIIHFLIHLILALPKVKIKHKILNSGDFNLKFTYF
jgi:hypothetical protein